MFARPRLCSALLVVLAGALVAAGCAGRALRTDVHVGPDPASRATWEALNGAWQGAVGASAQRVNLRFEGARGYYDLPEQRVIAGAISAVHVEGASVRIELGAIGAVFTGRLESGGERLVGNFEQNGRRPAATATRVPLTTFDYLAPRWSTDATRQRDYDYSEPAAGGDGWRVAHLDPHSVRTVTALVEDVLSEELPGVESLLVEKGGELLVDEYFYGFEREQTHSLRSVTKTMASVLTGVALQQGYLTSVDTPLVEFFPELADEQGWGERKRRITLAHLLTMTSGLEGDDWRDGFAGSHAVWKSPDWVAHVLARAMVDEPGTRFAYSGSSLMALSGALEVATGMPLQEFAERHLFGPLGIESVVWKSSPQGTPYLGSGLELRPRDLAKIGRLFLDGGRWNGRQVVSEAWVGESTRPRRRIRARGLDYGYLWWIETLGSGRVRLPATMALGLGGQRLMLVPDRDLVVVVTSRNYDAKSGRVRNQAFGMLTRLFDVDREP